MPAQRDRILFKYIGEHDEHLMGIPQRDIMESDKHWLSDEQIALLGQAAFYRPRNDADELAEAAAKRAARSEDVPPMAERALADMPEPPAPKDAPKVQR